MDEKLPEVTTEFVEAKIGRRALNKRKAKQRKIEEALALEAARRITDVPLELRKFVMTAEMQENFRSSLAAMVKVGDPEGMRIAANLMPKETAEQIKRDLIEQSGAKTFDEIKIAVEAWNDIRDLDSPARVDLCVSGLEAEFVANPGYREAVVKRLGGVMAPEVVERS
jgi:hypothetical protein